ncbi:MAG: type II secretion system GspH family protein [Gammaproteobacteria bacterium]|nr:type II secretion system GspH family protein [Gammaproteobacteria bacterium]
MFNPHQRHCKTLRFAQDARGFTLIELIVVMAVISVVMMLVGPLSQTQVERSKAFAEWMEVQRVFELVAKEAYLDGESYTLHLDGAELSITNGNATKEKTYQYTYVFFPKQEIHINHHGYVMSASVDAFIRSKKVEYRFKTNRERTGTNAL